MRGIFFSFCRSNIFFEASARCDILESFQLKSLEVQETWKALASQSTIIAIPSSMPTEIENGLYA